MTAPSSSSDLPASVEEAVEWLCRDGISDPAETEDLVRRMVSLPHPFAVDQAVTPGQAWLWITEFGYLVPDGKHGWVTREGRMHSAVYGAHDRLLYWMGVDFRDAENAGWCRIGPHGFVATFRLSKAQKIKVEEAGFCVDASDERRKPAWNGKPVRQAAAPTVSPRL